VIFLETPASLLKGLRWEDFGRCVSGFGPTFPGVVEKDFVSGCIGLTPAGRVGDANDTSQTPLCYTQDV
jgi:hypothetical protein